MRKSHAYQVSLIAITAAAMLGGSAFAQTAPAPSKDGAAQGLEEVVVVARRTEERLQDVPVTITAISAQTIQDTQIQSGTDLIKLIPTLSVHQGATGPGVTYALRGIHDGVITYFADVPNNTSYGTSTTEDQLWDLSSIQGLAGPQGTLFGKNSTGGAILFVPQRPTKTLGGYVDASYGNYNYEHLNAVVNLPVNDQLQLRLGGNLVKHDGMVKNIGGGNDMQAENRYQFRASALYQPTSNISDYLVADYNHRNESPIALISGFGGVGELALAYTPAQVATVQAEQARQDQLGIRTISTPYNAYDHDEEYGLSNTFAVGLGHGMTFKYILGYRYSKSDDFSSKSDYTFPVELGQGVNSGTTQWTHEIQLLGKTLDDKLTYAVGFFDLDASGAGISNYQLLAQPTEAFIYSNNITHFTTFKNGSEAGYGQATYALTDKLNFTAGVRYTRDTASQTQTGMQPAFFFTGPQVCNLVPGAVGVAPTGCFQSQSAVFSAVTYNISLDYHLSKNVLLYFTTRKGYNGGGFNTGIPENAPPGAPQGTYNPEYVNDYELGAKTEGLVGGMPFRANVSAYLADYTNIQRTSFGVTATSTYTGISNGPAARIYGFQLESVLKPTRDFTIALNYGFLHTGYTQGAPGFDKNNVFGYSPEHSVNLSGNYHHDLAQGGAAVATLSYAYQSQITFEDVQAGLLHAFQPGYGVLDGRIGWESVMNKPVDVTFFVKNMTDVAYAIERQDQTALVGFTGTVYNDPRTYGIEVRYRFGG